MGRSTTQERSNKQAVVRCDTCGYQAEPSAWNLYESCLRFGPGDNENYCPGIMKEYWEEAVPLKGTAGFRLAEQWKKIADQVFAIGSTLMIFFLLPTVFGDNKPEVWTSLPTAVVLTVFAYTYATLNLWRAASMTLLTSILWYDLAFQVAL
jgi:hypothetical protein